MKKDSILSENKGGRETIEDIRANLYIADEAYDELWNEWEHDIVKAVRKYELDKDIIYVFESDLQHEVDYLDEEGYSMEIVDNVDGLIFYKTLPKLNESNGTTTITKQEFLEKHDLTKQDYRNLIRYEKVRASGGMNMVEYINLMRNFNANGGERLAQWIKFENNYGEFLEVLKNNE